MPIGVRIRIDDKGFSHARMAERYADLSGPHERVNVYMLAKASDRLRVQIRGDLSSGQLLRSLAIGTEDNIAEVGRFSGAFGSKLPYAAKVNDGDASGPIVSSRGPDKFLAIPIGDAARRYSVWPSQYDPQREKLRFRKSKAGNSILFDPDNPEYAWVLVKQVFWGPGYRYAEFTEADLKVIEGFFVEHVTRQ